MSGSMWQDRKGEKPEGISNDVGAERNILTDLQVRHITAGLLTMTAEGVDAITRERYQHARDVAVGIASEAEKWKEVLGLYHRDYEREDKKGNIHFTSKADSLYAALGASALGQFTADPKLIAGSSQYFGDFLINVLLSDQDASMFKRSEFDEQAQWFVYHASSHGCLPNRSIIETYKGALEDSLSFAN